MLPEQRGAGLAVKAVTVCDTLYCSVPPCHGGVAGHDSRPGMTHACLGECRQGGPGPLLTPALRGPLQSPPGPSPPAQPVLSQLKMSPADQSTSRGRKDTGEYSLPPKGVTGGRKAERTGP